MDLGARRVAEGLYERFEIGRRTATLATNGRLSGASIGGHDT